MFLAATAAILLLTGDVVAQDSRRHLSPRRCARGSQGRHAPRGDGGPTVSRNRPSVPQKRPSTLPHGTCILWPDPCPDAVPDPRDSAEPGSADHGMLRPHNAFPHGQLVAVGAG